MAAKVELDTNGGPARVWISEPSTARFLLVVTHGAAGGVDAADLVALRDAASHAGGVVAAVEQPYRVAGRRSPGGATAKQDALWCEVVRNLRDRYPQQLPLVLAGRSNGARVACRTARELDASAVVAFAFPLHPPGKPERSRAAELRGSAAPVLVLNGNRDPFGVPEAADVHTLVVRPGERHDLARNPAETASLAVRWVQERLSLR